MSTTAVEAVRGRWGWYALDYATFREVKEFHRLLLRDRRATKRWSRWDAKLPENRVGPEPRCLGTDQRTYRWVLDEYRRIRHPQPSPEAVAPVDLPENWQAVHAKLVEFYGGS